MVLFLLYLKAEELENVDSISLQSSSSSVFCISVRNPLSDYETRENVVVNAVDDPLEPEQEKNSREPACHFRLTWEGSKKASTLTVLTEAQVKTALKKKKDAEKLLPRSYTSDDMGKYCPILAVECRGLEPYAFFPNMGTEFVVTSQGGGTVFRGEDVDLSEGDWADYDTENDQPVSISDISFKWEAV